MSLTSGNILQPISPPAPLPPRRWIPGEFGIWEVELGVTLPPSLEYGFVGLWHMDEASGATMLLIAREAMLELFRMEQLAEQLENRQCLFL